MLVPMPVRKPPGVSATLFCFLTAVTLGFLIENVEGRPFTRRGDYFVSSGFPRPWTPQFRTWYPRYGPELSFLSKGRCNATLRDYNTAYFAPQGSLEASELLSICYQHEACVYDGLPTDEQLNFQSAAVILGLMPTLMSSIGVSVSEIALLSAHRPVLSLLISLAAPAIWPTRIFEYNDPGLALSGGDGTATKWLMTVPHLKPWAARTLSLVEYAIAFGAVINISLASKQMGEKTILSWGCTTVFVPLLWTALAAVPHVPAALSYGIVRWKDRWQGESERSSTVWHRWVSMVETEVTVCANQTASRRRRSDKDGVPTMAVILNIFAGGLSFVYLFVGTVAFSSLVFISVWEVLNEVLWRFIISTAAARLILIVELAGLRGRRKDGDHELIQDATELCEVIPTS